MATAIMEIHPQKREPLIIGQTVYRSSNDYILNDDDLRIAREELDETEETKKACLKKCRENLSRETTKYRTDDEYLLRYLRFRKYDCDRALKAIRGFYSKRGKYYDMFIMLPSNLEALLNVGFMSYLPYTDENGCVVFLLRFGKWIPSQASLRDLLSASIAIFDITTMNPHFQVNGIKALYNMEGLGIRHFPDFLKYLMLMVSLLQDCYPWRIKQVIVINCSSLHLAIYRKLAFIVNKKIYQRFKMLGSDYSELHTLINPAILPKEFGGNIEENEYNITKHIMDNLPYLRYERSFGCKTD